MPYVKAIADFRENVRKAALQENGMYLNILLSRNQLSSTAFCR